jgi:hypothetical protein
VADLVAAGFWPATLLATQEWRDDPQVERTLLCDLTAVCLKVDLQRRIRTLSFRWDGEFLAGVEVPSEAPLSVRKTCPHIGGLGIVLAPRRLRWGTTLGIQSGQTGLPTALGMPVRSLFNRTAMNELVAFSHTDQA